MSDKKQVNEADLDWFAERDQPLTDAIRAAEAPAPAQPTTLCKCGHQRGDHQGMGPSRGKPVLSACGACECNQWRPQAAQAAQPPTVVHVPIPDGNESRYVEVLREQSQAAQSVASPLPCNCCADLALASAEFADSTRVENHGEAQRHRERALEILVRHATIHVAPQPVAEPSGELICPRCGHSAHVNTCLVGGTHGFESDACGCIYVTTLSPSSSGLSVEEIARGHKIEGRREFAEWEQNKAESVSKLLRSEMNDSQTIQEVVEKHLRGTGSQDCNREWMMEQCVTAMHDYAASLEARLATVTGERDRQYEFNAGQIVKLAELEQQNEHMMNQLTRIRGGMDDWHERAEAAEANAAELQGTFDLMWAADQRAIKQWQAATGKDGVWPDRTALTTWLLERVEAAEAQLAEQDDAAAIRGANAVMMIRCMDHREVPQLNTKVSGGAECAVCAITKLQQKIDRQSEMIQKRQDSWHEMGDKLSVAAMAITQQRAEIGHLEARSKELEQEKSAYRSHAEVSVQNWRIANERADSLSLLLREVGDKSQAFLNRVKELEPHIHSAIVLHSVRAGTDTWKHGSWIKERDELYALLTRLSSDTKEEK